MVNMDNEATNINRVRINGSIIIPEIHSKEEFTNKFNVFIKDNGFNFMGEIGELIPIIKLTKPNANDDLMTIWNNVIGVIQKELTEISFNTWIKPITPYSVNYQLP